MQNYTVFSFIQTFEKKRRYFFESYSLSMF